MTGRLGLGIDVGGTTVPIVTEGAEPCGCGRRGCLGTVASGRALADRVRRLDGRTLDACVAEAGAALLDRLRAGASERSPRC